MKKLLKVLILALLSITTFAQSPQKMSYQAVIRDANANLVTNQVVGMRLSILQGSASGTVVYTETQTSTTNTNGLLTIELGGGSIILGDFATINWANGPYFMKTETDPTGGTNYTITGTSQFLSVPYALYALNSAIGPQGIQGPKGDTGAIGPQGIPGVDGKTVLNGTNDPSAGIGTNGDFYINTSSNKIFGPKSSGTWGNGINLVGPQGIQGLTGATGPQGQQGMQGIAGLNGMNGQTVLNGTNDPSNSIGTNGDFYINTSTNKIFGPKSSGTWGNGVNLVGPQGIQGLTGATGPQGQQGIQGIAGLNGMNGQTVLNGTNDPSAGIGSNGDFYINTSSNKIFGPKTSGVWGNGVNLVGTQGIQGLTGATGSQGVSGLDGKTVLNGTNDPSANIGTNGDFYINTSSNKIFGPKSSGIWGNGVNLVGNQGIQGLTGTTGPQGQQGMQGIAGLNGMNGQTVLNGTNDPSANIGTNGDFYINTSSNKIFGPKTLGAWGNGVNLVGPQGIQGVQGAQGQTGPAGPQGISGLDGKTVLNGTSDPSTGVGTNGDFYINTSSNKIFGPKDSGVWGNGVNLVGNQITQSKTGTGHLIVLYTNTNYAYAFSSNYNNWYSQYLSGTVLGSALTDYSAVIYTNNYVYAFNIHLTTSGTTIYASWTTQSLSGTVLGSFSSPYGIVVYTNNNAYGFCSRTNNWYVQSLSGTFKGITSSDSSIIIYTNNNAYAFNVFAYGGYSYSNWTTQSLNGLVQKTLPE